MTTYTTTANADPHTISVIDDPDLATITITETGVTLNLDPVEFTAAVTSVAGQIGAVTLDTDDVTEGDNLYFTDARADARIAEADTDDIDEGSSNLYYTTARHNDDFDTRLATKDTDDITEGSNLYFTNARADARAQLKIDELVDGAPGALNTLNEIAAAINDDADVFTTLNDLITTNADNIAEKLNTDDFNTTFDTRLATKDTDNLSEGDNLYYTNARADARVNLQTGANLDLSSKSTTNLSEGSNLYYTDARANSAIDTRVTGSFIDALDTVSDGGTY